MARIAIVEHDPIVRDLIVSALGERGHDVVAFTTLREALPQLTKAERLDLLVTAVTLPDGDGLELVARLRTLDAELPAIVVTELASEADYRRAFRVGATDCLAKPFTREELLARCAFRLRRGAEDAEARDFPVDAQGLAFGRYEVRRVIGRGSHGTVHGARDVVSGQEVALKVLAPWVEDEVRLRFLREIYVLSSVRHEAVARVLDFGNAEGRLYHAMARVEGPTLRDHVLGIGRLTEPQVLSFLPPLASALAALDEAGVIHRDLKPANVILELGQLDRPVLIDFGLAKRSFDRGLTDPETILGTPGFIAPEVALGRDPDGRADVFALGMLALYGLLGGELYPELNGMALVSRMAERPVLLPQGLSPHLREVLRRMTALTPAERPTARDLGRLLKPTGRL